MFCPACRQWSAKRLLCKPHKFFIFGWIQAQKFAVISDFLRHARVSTNVRHYSVIVVLTCAVGGVASLRLLCFAETENVFVEGGLLATTSIAADDLSYEIHHQQQHGEKIVLYHSARAFAHDCCRGYLRKPYTSMCRRWAGRLRRHLSAPRAE